MNDTIDNTQNHEILTSLSLRHNPTDRILILRNYGEGDTRTDPFNSVAEATRFVEQNLADEAVKAWWHNCQQLKPTADSRKRTDYQAYTSLFIDVDRRVKTDAAGNRVNATDEERKVLYDTACKIAKMLRTKFECEAEFSDSGNGYHIVFALEPTADLGLAESIYKELLAILRAKFEAPELNVEIDQKVHDAPRVSTIYGTMNRKYPETPGRPQRKAVILSAPKKLTPVRLMAVDLFCAENAVAPANTKCSPVSGSRLGEPIGTGQPISGHSERVNQHWLKNYGWGHWMEWAEPYWVPLKSFKKDGAIYHPSQNCPVCTEDGIHEHRGASGGKTAIIEWADGGFGLSCFSSDCEMTLGEMLAKVNWLKGESYPHKIWEEQADDFSDFEIIDCEAIGPVRDAVPGEVVRIDDSGTPAPAPAGMPITVKEPEPALDFTIPPFPESCLIGNLGEYAKQIEMPLGVAYPGVLGCYSVIPIKDEFCKCRTNLYVCLIMPAGGGKNEIIKRSLAIIGVEKGEGGYIRSIPGGDRQLMELIGDKPPKKRGEDRIPGPSKLLLVNNEIADVLKKTTYDKSSLASRLCDCWDENWSSIPDYRGGTVTADCRLSWIGGLPASVEKQERFLELFSAESAHGLWQRFLFGYTDENWLHSDWECPPAGMPITEEFARSLEEAFEQRMVEINEPEVKDISPGAREMYEQWKMKEWETWTQREKEGFGRLRYNLKKIALLTTAADGLEICDEKHMAAAIQFMEWQIHVKNAFVPSEALMGHKEAEFTNLIIRSLLRKGADKEYVGWRGISLNNHWDERIDPGIQLRTVTNLVRLGRLIEEDDSSKKFKKVKVRVVIGSGRNRAA